MESVPTQIDSLTRKIMQLEIEKEALKKQNTQKIRIPVLLFQADHDVYVRPEGQNKLQRAVSSLQLVFCPGTLHEMYLGPDDFLTAYYSTIFNFIDNSLK